jgi:hypothetical protein
MINGEVETSISILPPNGAAELNSLSTRCSDFLTRMFDCAQHALAGLGALQILNHEGKHSSRDPVVLDDHDRYHMRSLEGLPSERRSSIVCRRKLTGLLSRHLGPSLNGAQGALAPRKCTTFVSLQFGERVI